MRWVSLRGILRRRPRTAPRRVNVYIDGFNLYYGALRNRWPGCNGKWLDVRALAELFFPNDEIRRVRYFTARVTARPNDPNQPQRQQAYLRALATDGVELHYGQFMSKPRKMKRVAPCTEASCPNPNKVEVFYTEEKGSDVALASYLVRDSLAKDMDVAVVVSNDTDLIAPLQIARNEAGIYVALISPSKYAHRDLQAEADYVRSIRRGHLEAAQFPYTLQDSAGKIHCPPSWRKAP